MPEPSFSVVIFYAFAVLTVGSAAAVAFSSNIVYSAFALMGTLFGVAAMYVFLAADFVAAAQLLIYIGGILVLILFAVMLTHRIATVDVSNRSVGRFPDGTGTWTLFDSLNPYTGGLTPPGTGCAPTPGQANQCNTTPTLRTTWGGVKVRYH